MAVSAAYPGVRAVFKDLLEVEPDLLFDVVLWKERYGSEVGMIVVPGHPDLFQPAHAPVPANYKFAGYAYCQ